MNLGRPALTSGAASLFDDRRASRTESSGLTLLRSGLAGGRCIFRVLLLAPPLVEGTVASALAFRGDGCSGGALNLSAVTGGGASETLGSSAFTRDRKVLRNQRVGRRSSAGRLRGGKVFIISVCFQGKRRISRLLREELAGLDISAMQRLDTVQQFWVGLE